MAPSKSKAAKSAAAKAAKAAARAADESKVVLMMLDEPYSLETVVLEDQLAVKHCMDGAVVHAVLGYGFEEDVR
jgi:3-hydroxyisobutyrate dehydrogenase-like beta-hydroxyacid dehydrogenase